MTLDTLDWNEAPLQDSAVPATKQRQSSRKPKSKKRTFRRKRLEADFLSFCQLSAETWEVEASSAEVQEVADEAKAFIYSADFAEGSCESILGESLLSDCASETPRASTRKVALPAHLAGLCEDKLLTPDQERALFQRMNFLKFCAGRIIDNCRTDSGDLRLDQWDLERTRGLLRAAAWHRDVIVKANVRLVISIVKKFVNTQCGFDDLLSDGIMALIRSVDKFDYQLGFRFSTYATQVVRRNSYRFVMDRQDERLKITNSISEPGLDIAEDDSDSTMSEVRWQTLRGHLGRLLDRLEKREKLIVRARFSLGSHRKVQTLQRLADKLGISKERVRQLEKRAMEKLQAMALVDPPEIIEVNA